MIAAGLHLHDKQHSANLCPPEPHNWLDWWSTSLCALCSLS